MANEFIIRKGLIALDDSQITGSLSVSNAVTASFFTGSFIGDGSQLSGVSAGFPFTGSAEITGSLGVTGSVTAVSFIGDGSQLTGIDDPTPITATINNTNSPFTITSQSIVIIDSTEGDVTINLPDLDVIDGTPDQKPILLYKNDYSQNVVFVNPSGSQLVNGTTQDVIVSIQIGVVYNPTSVGWVTEGTSYQSLAELELFFVPRTETGSLSVATASYVEYENVANKPSLISGSEQVTYSGLTGIPSGILSGSAQIADFGIFATTGSNGFNGDQSITGSLTVTGQVVAQTLNVQQVTSSIVYSSGSNIFGNELSNTQQFTGSMLVTGSLTVAGAGTFTTSITPLILKSTNATTMWTEYYYNTSTLSGYIGSGGGILSGANTSDFIIRSEADFVVATGGNNRRLTIASTGNLGLGVTPSAWFSDRRAFQIQSGGSINGSISTPSFVELGANFFHGSLGDTYISTTQATKYRQLSGAHEWYNAPSGTAGNAISFTQAMTLDASGRLGIGVTSISSWTKLEVAGTAGAQIDAAQQINIVAPTTTVAHGAGLRFNAASGAKEAVGIIGVVNEASGNLGAMTFHTYGGGGNIPERMRITSGGDVFFNRNASWSIFGDSGGAGIISDANGSALYATYDGAQSLGLSRRGSDGAIALFRRATTTVGTISVDSSSTAYNTSSDYRLKEDLKQINGLEKLSAIKVYDFKWKISEKRGDGVLAHELAEILPYAVHGEKDGEQMQGVDYSKLIPVLVKAIQEQQSQIEILKAEIQTLKQ